MRICLPGCFRPKIDTSAAAYAQFANAPLLPPGETWRFATALEVADYELCRVLEEQAA